MTEALIKKMEEKIPEKLMGIARYAGQAAAGFTVLGDWDALREFQSKINNRLVDKGWPLLRRDGSGFRTTPPDGGYVMNGLHGVVDRITEHKYVRSQNDFCETDKSLRNTLAFHLAYPMYDCDMKEVQDFVLKEENLAALDETVREITSEMEQVYGDPMTVQFNQQSVLKAVFDAVKDKVRTKKSPEGRLNKRLKSLVAMMRFYRDNMAESVPGIEFQGRMKEELKKMKWPFDPERGLDTLADEFWGAAHQAEFSTSLNVRLWLQDKTNPPGKKVRAAKDFILTRMDDISIAREHVANELNRELATDYGLVPRHVSIWYEDGRKKEVQKNQPPRP